MSYAHTKRRKLIARLKKKHPRDWRERFIDVGQACRDKQQQGPLLGSLQDLMEAK